MTEESVVDAVKRAWDKATAYVLTADDILTDDSIERAKLLIGVDVAAKVRVCIQTATSANSRSFAADCSNDNPLHCGELLLAKRKKGG